MTAEAATAVIATFRMPLESDTYLSRSIEECEREWIGEKEIFHAKFDDLLLDQLVRSKAAGWQRILVLDIGTSHKGGLLLDCANQFAGASEPTNTVKSKAFLEQNPDMNLMVLGFTDAKRSRDFLAAEVVLPSRWGSEPNPQVEIVRVGFSLTFNQSLRSFFESQNINPCQSVSLVLATQVLSYLHPRLFTEVIEDTVTALTPGGLFVSRGFADRAGTDLSRNVPPKLKNSKGFFSAFQQKEYACNVGNPDPDDVLDEYSRQLLERIKSMRFLETPVFNPELVEQLERETASATPEHRFTRLSNNGNYQVGEFRRHKLPPVIRKIKLERLAELEVKHPEAEFKHGRKVLIIAKKDNLPFCHT